MLPCRIVLVRTEIAANIGSVARIMRNFDAGDLVLVQPIADPMAEAARQLATHHGFPILEKARVVADLQTALHGCVESAATSARTGGLFRRQTIAAPEEIASRFSGRMASGPVALVFGPESHGLTNEELQRCDHLIQIPACEDYPVLNLAQAVSICLYSLYRSNTDRPLHANPDFDPASSEERERMFEHLQESLRNLRYLRGIRGDALFLALRHLITRANPSQMEVKLLHGLARQIQWVVNRAELPPDSSEDAHPH